MNKIYQGIILKVVPYKESDAIITLLTKDEGFVSFKARGVFKINSKNSSSLQLYTIGEYKLEYKTDYSNKTLSSSSVIYFPLVIYDDLKYSCLLGFASEVIQMYKDNYEESYFIMDYIIRNLETIDILTCSLVLLKYVLKWNGILFEVDACVDCKSKIVDAFSYESGGFLCHKCNENSNLNITNINYLKQIRIIMKANINNIMSFKVDEIIGYKIFVDLIKYIENNLGSYYKTKEMLIMVINNTDSRLT